MTRAELLNMLAERSAPVSIDGAVPEAMTTEMAHTLAEHDTDADVRLMDLTVIPEVHRGHFKLDGGIKKSGLSG